MREKLRQWKLQCNNLSTLPCFRGSEWDWQWKHQTDGNCIQPFFPDIIPMPSLHKHIFVGVMSTVLKPQIICLQFPTHGPATKCEINSVGVVPSSVEAFRKWEHNSDCAFNRLRTVHCTKDWTWLNGCDRDGRLMHQQPENIMRPFSPHIMPMPNAPK